MGHFNPAVTIMMLENNKLKNLEALGYIIVQVLGGLCVLGLWIYNFNNKLINFYYYNCMVILNMLEYVVQNF